MSNISIKLPIFTHLSAPPPLRLTCMTRPQKERVKIKQRQAESIANTKAK